MRWGLVIGVSLYLLLIGLLNIPSIQVKVANVVAQELSTLLNTELSIGRIDLGLFNRIIIEDLHVKDIEQEELLKVSRLSASFDMFALFKGKVSIYSVQLFGFDIKLHKETPESQLNLQFIIDALSSDSKNKGKLDIRINSLLMRRGKLSYHVDSASNDSLRFNAQHVNINNITGSISLKALQNDSINANIKRLSFTEESGIEISKLSLKVVGNRDHMRIDNIKLELPKTEISAQSIDLDYKNIESFEQFADKVDFKFNTNPSFFTLSDFRAFVPAFKNFNEKIDMNVEVFGTLNHMIFNRLYFNGDDNLTISGNGSIVDLTDPTHSFVYANLNRFYANQDGLNFLVRNFSTNPETPPVLKRLGFVNFQGELSGFFKDFVTYGEFSTALGEFSTDLKFTSDSAKNQINYEGSLQTKRFNLGKLMNDSKFGDISFDIHIIGQKLEARSYPNIEIEGGISELKFFDYNYENITIDGLYKDGGFDGSLKLDDNNASVNLTGSFNIATEVPQFNFIAKLNNVKPYMLHITQKDENALLSVNLDANFTGGTLEQLNGEININNLEFFSDRQNYTLNNFNIKAIHKDDNNQLVINSDFLKAQLNGKYTYNSIYSSLVNVSKHYVPAITKEIKTSNDINNNFTFYLDLYDSEFFTKFLNIPFQVYAHSSLKGYINDKDDKVHIEGYFPKFRYEDQFYESGMILIENPAHLLKTYLRLSKKKKKNAVNVSVESIAHRDTIQTNLYWGNSDDATYSGEFKTKTFFERVGKKKNSHLNMDISILPSNIILNDTIWNIHPSRVVLKEDFISVDNFLFTNNKQFLHIDGTVSKESRDSVKIQLNDIDLGYVFDIASIDDVDFKGKSTGDVYISNIFSKNPILDAFLHVKNFTFNDGPMGDMDILGRWDNEVSGIFLDAAIRQNKADGTNVRGHIYPIDKKGLDLTISAFGTNIKFLEGYMAGIASDVKGKAFGSVRLHGPFKALDLEGNLLANASLKFDVLNTTFAFNDTLRLTNAGIEFNDIHLRDIDDNKGLLTGKLNYKHFKSLSYLFNITSDNMMVINTFETPDFPLYGRIYASGKTVLSGDNEKLQVNAAVTSGPKSHFTYNLNSAATATNNQFIKFIDKTIYRNHDKTNIRDLDDEIEIHKEHNTNNDDPIDILLNLQVDGTPDLGIKIIIDPISGDYITAKGYGSVRTEYFNKDDVKMFGTYNITSGLYKFSLQEVIRKNFIIKDGSSITFNGDPMNATLNIIAQYTVNNVALADLLPAGSTLESQPHIKVNCIMKVTGQVEHPNISFELELPNERDDLQTLVRNYISTEEQLNMQVLYLLGIGKFYTTDNTSESSDMMSSVLSSTLSGQLNDMLSQIMDNNNWSFGTNVSTGTKGWTDVEVEGMLSGQLLNNRLLINGNFGYRDNPYANSNFVGDFEAELLLTRTGNIRLKAYSRTNDRYLFRTNLTTQGIGIMFRRDFMNWREFLFWNTIKTKRKAKQARLEEEKRQKKLQEEEDKMILFRNNEENE